MRLWGSQHTTQPPRSCYQSIHYSAVLTSWKAGNNIHAELWANSVLRKTQGMATQSEENDAETW